jgi:hypothetical protein
MKLAVVNLSEKETKTYSSKLKTQTARSFEMFMCLSHYTATYSRKKFRKSPCQNNQLNFIITFPDPLHVLPIIIYLTHCGS